MPRSLERIPCGAEVVPHPAGQHLHYAKGYCDYAWFREIDGRGLKFMSKVKTSLAEITARIRKQLMGDSHLLKLLSTLAEPPDWNAPRQLELFASSQPEISTGQQ